MTDNDLNEFSCLVPSGFRWRPASEVPEAGLSREAKERIFEKMDSVDEARRRAMADAHQYVIG